ncbi:MAG: hypothetical protein Q8R66_03845 [Methanobacteriaceae archaeon]|nr:hypothetical protein [Methanobacteriaceae archaeon]
MSETAGLTFIGFGVLGFFVIAIIFIFYEVTIFRRLEEILGIKMKRLDCNHMACYTYEGRAWLYLIIVSIFMIFWFYPVVISFNNFPAYVGLFFTGIYPLLIMIMRSNIFTDDSIPSARNPVYVGPNLVSGGPGYNSIHYLCFSASIGLASTLWGFSMLNSPDSATAGIALVFFGLVFQTLVLFPDVINLVSPWDLRTSKGLFFMTGFNITIIVFLLGLSAILRTIY